MSARELVGGDYEWLFKKDAWVSQRRATRELANIVPLTAEALGVTKHWLRVREFMLLAGQSVDDKCPPASVRKLRATLILEECLEAIEALGVDVKINGNIELKPGCTKPDAPKPITFDTTGDDDIDIAAIANELADISVVTIGTMVALGLPDEVCLEIVDRANLRKFGPGHRVREDGKLIKPPDFIGPKEELADYIAADNEQDEDGNIAARRWRAAK